MLQPIQVQVGSLDVRSSFELGNRSTPTTVVRASNPARYVTTASHLGVVVCARQYLTRRSHPGPRDRRPPRPRTGANERLRQLGLVAGWSVDPRDRGRWLGGHDDRERRDGNLDDHALACRLADHLAARGQLTDLRLQRGARLGAAFGLGPRIETPERTPITRCSASMQARTWITRCSRPSRANAP